MGAENYDLNGITVMKDVPYTGVRRTIGENFVMASQAAPNTHSFVRVDLTDFIAYRNKLKAEGIKVSMTAAFMKLAAAALDENPFANAALDGKKIHLFADKNIATAIASDKDLLYTPVVRNVEKKSVVEVDKELNALIAKVADGTLSFEDMSGATFSISNLGSSDVCFTSQILMPPMSCILGIGKTSKEVVVDDNDNMVIRQMGYFQITVDHRVIMGSHAIRFYHSLIELAKTPEKYLAV